MLTDEFAAFFKSRRKQWTNALKEYNGNQVKLLSQRWSRDPVGLEKGFNCVGLALELVPGVKKVYHGQYMVLYGESQLPGGFPKEGKEFYGLESAFPKVVWNNDVYALTVLEDNYNLSLKEVAGVLESQGDNWDGSFSYCKTKLK